MLLSLLLGSDELDSYILCALYDELGSLNRNFRGKAYKIPEEINLAKIIYYCEFLEVHSPVRSTCCFYIWLLLSSNFKSILRMSK